ncbi:Smr-domain-containing protein [Fomitiporia mediterranea MF3/22]|uniref:Smr-domain-containing protein n=1 Tax=Fomitiporia mediterranea (strain MF3/22) TaxID=694068 RepID=UPI00044082E7|nr:Smr-domain-containing protein [Fomitiporia mediterranea MF3/22]EJD02999.1 Smr-domain-containing protein [Fomitiporia mediterranea MF3/22]
MDQLFDASRAAYSRGDGAEAKELSNRAKGLKSEKERLDREAAEWIFEQNNKGREPGEVDLHGLRAEEAVERTEEFIIDCRKQGLSELRLIVGKGLHSQNHEAVLKPRIEELMKKHNIVAELDPENSGVLLVHLDGGEKTRDRGIDPEEITRRLGDDEKSCIIM